MKIYQLDLICRKACIFFLKIWNTFAPKWKFRKILYPGWLLQGSFLKKKTFKHISKALSYNISNYVLFYISYYWPSFILCYCLIICESRMPIFLYQQWIFLPNFKWIKKWWGFLFWGGGSCILNFKRKTKPSAAYKLLKKKPALHRIYPSITQILIALLASKAPSGFKQTQY